jgi:hypothetical protein
VGAVAHRTGVAIVLSSVVLALAPAAGSAASQSRTLTLVFDAVAKGTFVDKPPTGPSPGDIERSDAKLRDSSGRFIGTAHDKCVFTKMIPNDVLEQCSGSATTRDGTVTTSGVGHLYSLNPPWQVTGRSGSYKGLHGTQVFATDIPLDPNVPLAAGRGFSVVVIKVATGRRLHVGVVPRPAANVHFIRRANAVCDARQKQVEKLPGFPFSGFDPFHPDKQVLPKVGRFFAQPARRHLPGALLQDLRRLGPPPANSKAWDRVLHERQVLIRNQSAQIKAALADDAASFVRNVYQRSRDYNEFVFRSAIFGVQSCTFS